MRRVYFFALALAAGGVAAAGELPLVPPPGGEPLQQPSRTPEKLREIPSVWRQIDRDRVNNGTLGRINATRGEQQEMQTGWTQPPLGGNVM